MSTPGCKGVPENPRVTFAVIATNAEHLLKMVQLAQALICVKKASSQSGFSPTRSMLPVVSQCTLAAFPSTCALGR